MDELNHRFSVQSLAEIHKNNENYFRKLNRSTVNILPTHCSLWLFQTLIFL